MNADAESQDRGLTMLLALLERGDPGAEPLARSMRDMDPSNGELARLHGVALLSQRRNDEAIAALRIATQLAPDAIAGWLNMAVAARTAGDLALAGRALDEAGRIDPGNPHVFDQLGSLRRAQGDLDGARAAYEEALALRPNMNTALNLGAVELALGLCDAAGSRAAAMAVEPHAPAPAFLLLAQAHAARRDFNAAWLACTQGLARHPDDLQLHHQAGLVAEERGDHERAAQHYRNAVAKDGSNVRLVAQLQFVERQCCDWRNVRSRSTWLREQLALGRAGIAPFAFLAEPATPAEQRYCAELAARDLVATRPRRSLDGTQRPRRPTEAPMRVGVLSAGFHEHATALLATPMLEALAADRTLALRLYALSPDDGGPYRRRIAACAPLLDASELTDAALTERIRSDALDVLVDVEGWCGGGRPQLVASRLAPLQVLWLGFPGTGGAPWWDALIADDFVIPPERRIDYREEVACLPRCYQLADATRTIIPPPARGELGLPQHGMVYACFGQNYKLTPDWHAAFMDILRSVPNSVLWLLASHDAAHERLRAAARTAGIDPSRMVFAMRRPHGEYLGLLQHADLMLDTQPYNAHTTASDALYAGCPVLTCPGTTFAGRVAGSLNHHLGLTDCNADDRADFCRRAVDLGRDPSARASLRDRVAMARNGSVFDAEGYAHDFASLLRRLHEHRQRGVTAH